MVPPDTEGFVPTYIADNTFMSMLCVILWEGIKCEGITQCDEQDKCGGLHQVGLPAVKELRTTKTRQAHIRHGKGVRMPVHMVPVHVVSGMIRGKKGLKSKEGTTATHW